MTLTPEADALLFAPPPKAFAPRVASWALNVLFPPHCIACHAPVEPPSNTVLCRPCAERLEWIGTDRCGRCGDRVGAGSGVVSDCPSCRTHPPVFVEASCALGKFGKGPLRELVLSLKFGRKLHIAKPLGRLLAARVRATGLHAAGEQLILVPIPITPEHALRAGWNHAEEIANCAAVELNAIVVPKLLRKIRSTPPQATLKRMARRANLKGAFECETQLAEKYKGATVMLIDDVITTASTISECARTLSEAQFKTIRAAAIARA